ncbi:MAG: hypothetical protein WA096_01540 [Smithella sp.]
MIDYASSNINLIGFIFTLTMGLLMLFLPRRFAALPIIMTASFITLGQVINIASLNFTMFRIIIFFGLVRILLRKEVFSIRLHTIDKILIAYIITSAIAYLLLRNGSGEAFTSQLGFIYNSLFLYIIFRSLIHDPEDIKLIFKMLVLVVVPLAVAMLIEKATGRNLFSVFGGVPEFTTIRGGRLRCQGAFAHPILAGTFGATSLPFMLALWFKGVGGKWIAGLGIISTTIITITAASSGPVVTYIVVIIGMAMWRIRDHMRAVRWFILLCLISLHIVMKAPVWALIGKASSVIGGTGWHRVMLIDAAISHFNEWWLLGTDYTRHWVPTGVTWSAKHTDITNQFVSVGINGGFIALIIFIAVIVFCFKNIGIKLKEISAAGFPLKFTIWCLGVSLASHVASFTSVHYFDQIIVFWYLLLALITTISIMSTETLLANATADSPDPDRATP